MLHACMRNARIRKRRFGTGLYAGGLALLLAGSPDQAAAQSTRPGWGAIPYADTLGTGVTFRTWASNASSVAVAGTFNGWNMSSHPLTLESVTSGAWSADITSARTNHNYKYVINGSLWRSDPRSRALNAADNNNSIILNPNDFTWQGGSSSITNSRDLVIYEAHVGTFAGPSGTLATFINRLDYLRGLGISAIELMPVNEFPSATSWGYNPAYPFAIETNYGSPTGFKAAGPTKRTPRAWRFCWTWCTTTGTAAPRCGSSTAGRRTPGYGGLYFYNTDPYAFTLVGPAAGLQPARGAGVHQRLLPHVARRVPVRRIPLGRARPHHLHDQ